LTATYSTANTVNLSVKVGSHTYSVNGVTTNPSADTNVRLISDAGDYFNLQLRGSQGAAVANQSDANSFAARINAALSGLDFSQSRNISSYNGTGDLLGSSVSVKNDDFTGLAIDNIDVVAPTGSNTNASVIFTINGEAYTSQNALGGQIGANSVTTFVSASDPNKTLTFKNGSHNLDLSNANAASSVQSELRTAFGVGAGAAALNFQLGTTSDSTVKVSIASAKTADIFGGQTLSVATANDAATAATVLDTAISSISAIRAGVGALETQFSFASAALQSSVQNQDAARGQLLDTDIATESTSYATSQVKLQAGISVLAQANQQLQALLKLIG
jgi:flagellin